jgi:lipopolysaccharide/colanic/teichoic acid biosynthesis glycosyltransferase
MSIAGVRQADCSVRHTAPDEHSAEAAGVPRWKRILDLVLILLASPLVAIVCLLIAAFIKVVSPGPVFFRQERIGLSGRRFLCYKFRSMRADADSEVHRRHLEQLLAADSPMTKMDRAGDPRIIPGGLLLRAIGLDELPQLWNVVRGEMSLVGPRPCTPDEFQLYQAWQAARCNTLPGLTGLWQVSGKNKTTFTRMIELDIRYAQNLSLRADATILFRTLSVLFGQVRETVAPVEADLFPDLAMRPR